MAVKIPGSLEEVAELLHAIGGVDIEIERIETDSKEHIANLKSEADRKKKKLRTRKKELKGAIQKFATKHKVSLLKSWGGMRSTRLFSGVIGWRQSKQSIKVTSDEDKVIAHMSKDKELQKYLRITYSINKELLLDHPDVVEKIDGLEIIGGKRDTFFADPDPLEKKKPKE